MRSTLFTISSLICAVLLSSPAFADFEMTMKAQAAISNEKFESFIYRDQARCEHQVQYNSKRISQKQAAFVLSLEALVYAGTRNENEAKCFGALTAGEVADEAKACEKGWGEAIRILRNLPKPKREELNAYRSELVATVEYIRSQQVKAVLESQAGTRLPASEPSQQTQEQQPAVPQQSLDPVDDLLSSPVTEADVASEHKLLSQSSIDGSVLSDAQLNLGVLVSQAEATVDPVPLMRAPATDSKLTADLESGAWLEGIDREIDFSNLRTLIESYRDHYLVIEFLSCPQ